MKAGQVTPRLELHKDACRDHDGRSNQRQLSTKPVRNRSCNNDINETSSLESGLDLVFKICEGNFDLIFGFMGTKAPALVSIDCTWGVYNSLHELGSDDYIGDDWRVHSEQHSAEASLEIVSMQSLVSCSTLPAYRAGEALCSPAIDLLGILLHSIIVDDPWEELLARRMVTHRDGVAPTSRLQPWSKRLRARRRGLERVNSMRIEVWEVLLRLDTDQRIRANTPCSPDIQPVMLHSPAGLSRKATGCHWTSMVDFGVEVPGCHTWALRQSSPCRTTTELLLLEPGSGAEVVRAKEIIAG